MDRQRQLSGFILIFQPSRKSRRDDDARCHSIASTFKFPAKAKKVSTPKTWLLEDKENKTPSRYQEYNISTCDDAESRRMKQQLRNGVVTVCEVNGRCINITGDDDDVAVQGTAV